MSLSLYKDHASSATLNTQPKPDNQTVGFFIKKRGKILLKSQPESFSVNIQICSIYLLVYFHCFCKSFCFDCYLFDIRSVVWFIVDKQFRSEPDQ